MDTPSVCPCMRACTLDASRARLTRASGRCEPRYAAVPALMVYLVAFGTGLSAVPWVVNAEIYPLHLRSVAIGTLPPPPPSVATTCCGTLTFWRSPRCRARHVGQLGMQLRRERVVPLAGGRTGCRRYLRRVCRRSLRRIRRPLPYDARDRRVATGEYPSTLRQTRGTGHNHRLPQLPHSRSLAC